MGKTRLDIFLVENNLALSRERAKSLIMAGKVKVNDAVTDKAGFSVSEKDAVVVKGEDHPYVSRGGLKLAEAFSAFDFSVNDHVCLDIGASTGGFTDCLLQHGAKKVYACDVGYGQIAWSLRNDPRVVVIERTNIRYMSQDAIAEKVATVVADTSFISLKTVLPAAEKFMDAGTQIVALIKPQFEAGRQHVGKGGVVKDSLIHQQVQDDLSSFFVDRGYAIKGITPSPILGPKGNREYLLFMKYVNIL